ncbi:glycosyltransferase family 4 protein [Halomarina ordinaria]|uniref:Glycosyltransferase family 4 protein n=1 Tax=Halomarina ordinaria TaxID=3033939 RepID=A0ABD5U3G7_9EURY|nr:glycosyltransferase family 4 protein [Halomarina sp. PSRA2]
MYPDYSGSNSYQRQLRDGLSECGYDVRLSQCDRPFPLLEAVRENGRPDVFHIHWLHRYFVTERAPLTAVLGLRLLVELLVLKSLGVRTVWTVHNLADHERRSPRLEAAVRNLAARLCDRLVVHCESARDLIATEYHLPQRVVDRIDVVPHGHYIDSYENEVDRETARERLGFDDERVFLYFGLIRPYKNVVELIETFAAVEDADARLLVVGSPWNDTIREEILGLAARDERVRPVLEFVPDEDIQVYMNAADVTVFPFEEVLTSGTALLAMSFGRPVVAPRRGCVAELVDDEGGFAYDPSAPNALRDALRTAAAADLAGMGAYNYEKVRQFDWDSIARKTALVYRRAGTE